MKNKGKDMKKILRTSIIGLVLNLLCIFGLNAEALSSPTWGYSLDLPEDFVLADRNGNSRYLFQHSIQAVDLQIALYSNEEFDSPEKTAEHVFSQLEMQHKGLSFIWNNKKALLAMVEFEYAPSEKYQKKKLAGWLLVVELPKQKGNLAMLSYTDKEKAKECEPLMISSLDMLFTDINSYFIPGPVSTALYPKTGKKEINYIFNGKEINFSIDKSDIEANKSVVNREFELLTIYLNHKSVFEAWKRFYKVIFRDAWSRIQPFTLAIQMNFPEIMEKSGINAETTASLLLELIQDFKYVRDRQGSDFTNLPQAVLEKEGDCDARSLLMVLMLKQMNIDSILLISQKKQHSLVGVDCKSETENYFSHIGKNYTMAETTAHVKLGEIDDRLKSGADWFVVDFFVDSYIRE